MSIEDPNNSRRRIGGQHAAFDLQGHRGARGLWPENTLAGFEQALALGVSTLELDCAVTRDGVVVISHDPLLNPDHTRDAQGQFLKTPGPALFSLTYEQLQQYDVGRLRPGSDYAQRHPLQQPVDGQRIPRLADLFVLVKRLGCDAVRFNIETKIYPLRADLTTSPEAFTRGLVADIVSAGLESRTTIQSFDWRTLRIAHAIAPEIVTVALTDQQADDDTVQFGKSSPSPWLGGLNAHDFAPSVPRLVKASGATVWSPNYLDLDADRIAEAHALSISVIPWTVNEPTLMNQMIGMGVDGLITDRPDLLRQVLASAGVDLPIGTAVPPGINISTKTA